jgi:hypothetical protein
MYLSSSHALTDTVLQVLSPVQTARYLVASYPMGPDTLSLMTCLAQQRGEPSTSELLQTARPRTAAAGENAAQGRPGFDGICTKDSQTED